MTANNDEGAEASAVTAGQARTIRNLLIGIFTILAIMAMYFARDVLLPVVLGILLALTLSPIVRSLSRIGVPAALSAVVLVLGLGSALFAIAWSVSGPVTALVADAQTFGPQLERKLRGVAETVEAVRDASEKVDEITETAASDEVQKVVIKQPGLLNSAVTNLASVATSAMLALVLTVFLLASDDLFYEKLIGSFRRFADKKKALRTVYDIERRVSRYLLTITIINAGLGCAVTLALWAIGLPEPYVWGIFAFLLNFLPYIGALFGTVLVGIYAIITFPTLGHALLAPGAYLLLTTIEGQFVTPTVVGRRLELNTVSVFLTVVFWGWLWGIAGALMAVPFLVLVKVICDNVDSLRGFGRFLGARDLPLENGGGETQAA